MSHTARIIGIPGLLIERVDKNKGIEVWAKPSFRPSCKHCHSDGLKIKATHHISPATVERWYQHHISQRRSEMSNRPCPRVLGIDEHFFTRKHGYATTFVDLKNHKVFDVKLGRSEPALRRYLRTLEGKSHVKVVVMDLSETYRSIARRYFPEATIVADRFHVVRLINQHFLKLWQTQDPEGKKNRGLISLMRRHQWHLQDEQHANPMSYLARYPVLQSLYVVKQKLIRFMLLKTLSAQRARTKLRSYLDLIE